MFDTYCVLPYNHISIDSVGGTRMCCNYNIHHNDFHNEFFNILDEQNPDAILNSQNHRKLKNDIQENVKHKFCDRCWMVEGNSGQSVRQVWNYEFENHVEIKVEYLELTLGNKCNLKCRMCNPWSSSLWANDIKQYPELNHWNANMDHNFEYYDDPKFNIFLDNVLPTITRLNFLGGEPLLIEKYYEILQKVIDLNRAHLVTISFNTNLLALQDKNFTLWKEFKQVIASLSCDGVYNLNEYIRYPGKWDMWHRNIEKIINWRDTLNGRIQLQIHSTLSSLTWLNMNELLKFAYELNLVPRVPHIIYVNQPKYLDPVHLPDKIKQEGLSRQLSVLDTFSESTASIKNLLYFVINNDRDEGLWEEFIIRTKQLDKTREQNILDYIPEYDEYF